MSNHQADITIYLTTFCPYCIRAKSLLNTKKVQYTEINLDEEPQRRAEMIQKSKGVTSVPQIFIGEEHIGGCDDMYALERQGKLDNKLFPA